MQITWININYTNIQTNNNFNKNIILNKNNDKSNNEKIENINTINDIKQEILIKKRKSDKMKNTHFLLNKLKELTQKSNEQMKKYQTNANNKVSNINNIYEVNQIESEKNINTGSIKMTINNIQIRIKIKQQNQT